MTRSAIALLLLASGAACTPGARASAAVRPAAAPDPYATCWSREDAEACAAGVERATLAGSGGRARRSGDRLEITAADGRVVPLANDATEGDRFVRYRYRAYLAEIGYHLVEVGFYEGGGFVLVSAATGDETHVHGVPVVAPDRARFVATSVDLVAGYDPNGIQVWRLTGTGPRLEWGVDGGDAWGASDPAWIDPATVEFTRHLRTADPDRPERTRMRLTLRGGGLALHPLRR